ncbi:MAG: DNA polymerase II small subunit, partial [Methanosarcinaceae archaeon]|nr:DNA polymerase II small subunit [Methanosarcinaceae archaeon]
MDEIEIIKAFSEAGYQVSPEAVEIIRSSSSPLALIASVLATIEESVFVIQPEHISEKEQFAKGSDSQGISEFQASQASQASQPSSFSSISDSTFHPSNSFVSDSDSDSDSESAS